MVLAHWGSNALVWHFRLGCLILSLLAPRVVWGPLGGRSSSFASFIYSPATLLRCSRGGSRSLRMHDVGNNALGALSVFEVLAISAAQWARVCLPTARSPAPAHSSSLSEARPACCSQSGPGITAGESSRCCWLCVCWQPLVAPSKSSAVCSARWCRATSCCQQVHRLQRSPLQTGPQHWWRLRSARRACGGSSIYEAARQLD